MQRIMRAVRLSLASRNGYIEIASMLLEKEADVKVIRGQDGSHSK